MPVLGLVPWHLTFCSIAGTYDINRPTLPEASGSTGSMCHEVQDHEDLRLAAAETCSTREREHGCNLLGFRVGAHFGSMEFFKNSFCGKHATHTQGGEHPQAVRPVGPRATSATNWERVKTWLVRSRTTSEWCVSRTRPHTVQVRTQLHVKPTNMT